MHIIHLIRFVIMALAGSFVNVMPNINVQKVACRLKKAVADLAKAKLALPYNVPETGHVNIRLREPLE